ncbi:MAG: hypothetical protein FWD66_04430 [Paludibacter sp.]|nr:hypothetical protein [Paludibacter sp.]
MRNYFLALIAFLAFSFAGNAQNFKVTNNQTVMLEKSGRIINTVIKQNYYAGFDGKFHYFIVDEKTLLKADESLKKITPVTLDKKFDAESLTNFYAENVAGLICLEHNKNDFVIKKVIVGDKGLNETELLTISASKSDDYQADFSTSPDKKTKMIALTIISSKKELKSTFIFVINNQGDIIWSKNFEPNFDNKTLNFSDMRVDNDASVYVLATSFTKKVKKCNLTLFKINKNEDIDEKISIPVNFNRIGTMRMLVLSNGNIFVGGYYTEANEYNFDNSIKDLGTFSYVFDGQTLEKQNFKTKTLEESIPKGITSKQAYTGDRIKNIKGIYETTDGKVTMFAEEYIVEYSKYYPTNFMHGNVFIQSFDLNGNYENSSILFKNQIASIADFLVSFNVLINGDNLILIYNDNAKNDLSANKPKPKRFLAYRYKKGQTVACIIKNGLVGKKQAIINGKNEKRIFYNAVRQLDNKEAIIRVQTGLTGIGTLMLEKLSW